MADWVALFIALAALTFTIASFWWLNTRRGRLESYEPHSFAAHVSKERVLLRLPLVLFNTGAQPIVVQNLRVRFPEEDQPDMALDWNNTRTQLKPVQDDHEDLRAVFAVPGRAAVQKFVEFAGSFPGVVPRGRNYDALVEAKLGHDPDWTSLLRFTLYAVHINSPTQFITYSNTATLCSPDEPEKAKQTAESLLRRFGVAH
ncbi:hypothetical protein EF847_01045 [Actinobacteria bacterium YIM 96077]|uniref:Uncharacterized protein n=1 Tax=Phytoactinopolyspora halophila TaxID=1981511 RepID=A0A329R211_9ACTN|nr:hypothetical protein [Phytoactinopolyspora halophila]AYY11517.1 hypothetical protein EF847_01045 [Actinobacteria bacterium YIM 96077]RAW17999.1 hypothetical protein DPM12_03960 [Phytoactinopolyspora halophila]